MSTKLATTTFDTGGKDIVATVDVYKADPVNVPLNRAVTTVEQAVSGTGDALKKTASDTVDQAQSALKKSIKPKALLKALKTGKVDEKLLTGIPLTEEAGLALLQKSIGGGLGQINSLKDLKGDLLTSLLGSVGFVKDPKALAAGILKLPGSTDPINVLLDSNPKLKILNGVVKYIKNYAELDCVEGIISSVNALTGAANPPVVTDMKARFAVLGKLASDGCAAGLPFIIDSILGTLDPDEKPAFLLTTVKKAMENGDTYQLEKLLDYASVEQVAAKVPNPAAYHLSQYKLPSEYDSLQATAGTLITFLNRLEPGWDTTKRGSETVSNLLPFSSASADARLVLAHSVTHRVPASISPNYMPMAFRDMVARDYPRAGLPLRSASNNA